MSEASKFEAIMQDIERELVAYGDAVVEAQAWWDEWKRKHSGFRCKRRE